MSARDEVISLIDEFLSQWKESNFNFFMKRRSTVKELNNYGKYFSSEICNTYNFVPSRFIKFRSRGETEDSYNLSNIVSFLERYDLNLSVSEFQVMLDSYAKGMRYKKSLMDSITSRLVSESEINAEIYLNKYLDREVKARKVTFIESIENAGGDMVKVLSLKIGSDSMLNGVISCTEADVKIETVGAGGYNIQRFHYRILCHALNERLNKDIANDLKSFVAPKKKSKNEVLQLELEDYILKQAERLESKKNKEGKSRGKDLWDKITDLGYLSLIEKSGYVKYLDSPSYPIYIKDLDSERSFIWCMAFAYTLSKDASLPVRSRLRLIWNIEGTDSMERVGSMMSRLNLVEFEHLIPLMAKRGTFTRYGESTVEELKEKEKQATLNSLSTVEASSDADLKSNSEYETNVRKSFRDDIDRLEGFAEYRGIKVWERMKEYGYDKKLEDLGFKVYVQTKYYPYYFKDYPDYRIILSPTQGYMLTEYNSEYPRYNSMYYLVKGGSSKVSDVERLFKEYGHPELEAMFEVLNLRKKLTPYVSSSNSTETKPKDILISKFNLSLNDLTEVVDSILIDLNDKDNSVRLKKVISRFKESNFINYLCESGYDEVYLSSKGKKLPIPVYINKFNDYYLIIGYHQIYLLEESGRLITIGNVTSYDSTLKEITEFGEKYKIKDVLMFSKLNNLRSKITYI